jgi:outer membrane receptor protein involved in Fe transport
LKSEEAFVAFFIKWKKMLDERLKIIFVLISILSLFFLNEALAQEKDEPFKLQEMVVTGKKVETSSYEEKVFNKPQSITIIDKEEIERRKPVSVGDLIREIPGVEISQTATAYRKEPIIRGLGSHRVLILINGERLSSQTFLSGTRLSNIDVEEVEYVEIIRGPTSVRYGSDALGGVINIITKRFKPEEEFKASGKVGVDLNSAYDLHRERVALYGGEKGFDFNLSYSSTDAGKTKIPKCVWPYVCNEDDRMLNTEFEFEDFSFSSGYEIAPNHNLSFNYMRHRGKDIGLATSLEESRAIPIVLRDVPDLISSVTPLTPPDFNTILPPSLIERLDNFMGPMITDTSLFELPKTRLDMAQLKYLWKIDKDILKSFEIKGGWQKIGWEFAHAPHIYMPLSSFDKPPLSKFFQLANIEPNQTELMDMLFAAYHDSYAETFNFSTLGNFNLFEKHKFSSGIEYRNTKGIDDVSDHRQITIIDMIPMYSLDAYSDPKIKQDNIRFFLEDEFDIGRFTFTLGLNYEWLRSKQSRLNLDLKGSSWSKLMYELLKRERKESERREREWDGFGGAFGIILHLNPNLNLTGVIARGIRLPTVEETFFITPHSGSIITGNPYLDPEKSINYEIGIKANYPRLFLASSFFYTKIDDMVALACPRYNQFMENTFGWENMKEVKIWGSEVSGRYFVSDEWSFYTNIAYTHTEEEGDKKMAEPPPPWKGVTGILFSKRLEHKYLDKFWIELYTKFAGHIKDRPPALNIKEFYFNPPYVPGYAIYNIAMGINLKNIFGIKESKLVFKIENLTDKLYFEGISGSPHGLRNFPQAGRNFVFSWTGIFDLL